MLIISLILFLDPENMVVVIDTADVAGRGAAPLADGSVLPHVHIHDLPHLLETKNEGASLIPIRGPGLRHGRRRPSPDPQDPGPHPHARRRNPVPVLAHRPKTKKSRLPPKEMLHLALSWTNPLSRRAALYRHMIAIAGPDPRLPRRRNDE